MMVASTKMARMKLQNASKSRNIIYMMLYDKFYLFFYLECNELVWGKVLGRSLIHNYD